MGGNTADTLKDGLLLGGGIHHITATSLFTRGSKQVPACDCLNMFIFSNISHACAKEYSTTATYYCQVEVKVCDRIGVVISEIIGLSGRHFSAHFLW